MTKRGEVAVVGLGVMGANLALNLADMGNDVVVFNRTESVTEEYLTGEAGEKGIRGAKTLEEAAAMMERPRTFLLMVKAGDPVDQVIASLSDCLE
ncbi:MAG: NAD(P)-binding domain-containing protein, partial [Acidimicrobiia bacterium]